MDVDFRRMKVVLGRSYEIKKNDMNQMRARNEARKPEQKTLTLAAIWSDGYLEPERDNGVPLQKDTICPLSSTMHTHVTIT